MKCPKCGARVYRVNIRPTPGMNPLMRFYHCRAFLSHSFWEARGRKPLAPRNKPHMLQMELPLPLPNVTLKGGENES